MILLAVTLCLSSGGTAECHRDVRLMPSAVECVKIGRAAEAYLRESQAPGVEVVFVGYSCAAGVDG